MLTAYMRDRITRTGWAAMALPWTQGERVLVIADPTSLKPAQEQHPGLVDYLLEELALLDWHKRDFTALRNIHLIKKIIGGRVCKPPYKRA
ncbi:MAG: hypothetical protein A2218_10295 [Elusimicrobia bacterium RIFOXYA2_FULL_53_38]|nr:MAG: hypothetical protein A2218_10295 [Elusimicrobia bacterium RIFOXYA2_FULL_53_38]